VTRAKLTERLDDDAIEELQSQGAGPLTVEELERHRERSMELPAAKPVHLSDFPSTPSPEEQLRVLTKATDLAMQYTASLPNFICTQNIQRYVDERKPKSGRPATP